jgi:hypothetical protein
MELFIFGCYVTEICMVVVSWVDRQQGQRYFLRHHIRTNSAAHPHFLGVDNIRIFHGNKVVKT